MTPDPLEYLPLFPFDPGLLLRNSAAPGLDPHKQGRGAVFPRVLPLRGHFFSPPFSAARQVTDHPNERNASTLPLNDIQLGRRGSVKNNAKQSRP